jgi:sugar lactone lactonase YvrE
VPVPAQVPAPAPGASAQPSLRLRADAQVVEFGRAARLRWNRPENLPAPLHLDASLGLPLGPIAVGDRNDLCLPVRHRTRFSLVRGVAGVPADAVQVAARGLDYLAGDFGGAGHSDGHRSGAPWRRPRFVQPRALARDAQGTVYVVDEESHVLRRITPGGRVITLAGAPGKAPGRVDGRGSAARFNEPQGIAVDRLGDHIYVADTGNDRIRLVHADGRVETLRLDLGLDGPEGLALNAVGDHLFVADTGHGRIVQVALDGSGRCRTLAVPDGLLAAPVALVAGLDSRGLEHLYVADEKSHLLVDIPTAQPGAARVLAGASGAAGHQDGHGAAARFRFPQGLSLAEGGRILVADAANQAIRAVTTEAEGPVPAGTVSTLFRSPAQDGDAGAGLNWPSAVLADGKAGLLVADTANGVLRHIDLRPGQGAALSLWAGSLPAPAGDREGLCSQARFDQPGALAVGAGGDVFLVDNGNHAIRRITPAGMVSTFARAAEAPPFWEMSALAAEPGGSLLVADFLGSVIERVMPDGSVTRFAGLARPTGQTSFWFADGDREQEARFLGPRGLARGAAGTVWVSDGHSLRQIRGREVRTLAGHPREAGLANASGRQARFTEPHGLALGPDEHLYVADCGNHVIRRVSPDGTSVETWAGLEGQPGNQDGPSISATLEAPIGLVFGQDKALYVIGKERSGVRRIDWANRSISTLVRADGETLGLNTESGQLPRADGTEPERPARIALCRGIAATEAGDLLVTTRLDDESSGGVVQVTAPAPEQAVEAADADGPDWDLDEGVLAQLLGYGEAASDAGIPAAVMQAAATALAGKPGFRPPARVSRAAAAAAIAAPADPAPAGVAPLDPAVAAGAGPAPLQAAVAAPADPAPAVVAPLDPAVAAGAGPAPLQVVAAAAAAIAAPADPAPAVVAPLDPAVAAGDGTAPRQAAVAAAAAIAAPADPAQAIVALPDPAVAAGGQGAPPQAGAGLGDPAPAAPAEVAAAQGIPPLQMAILAAAVAAGNPVVPAQPVAALPAEAGQEAEPDLPLELMAESMALPCTVQ